MKDHPRLNDIGSVRSQDQDSVAKTIKEKKIKIPDKNPNNFYPFEEKQKDFFDNRAKPVNLEVNTFKKKKNSFLLKSDKEDSDKYEDDFDIEEDIVNKVADNILSTIKSPTDNSKNINKQRKFNIKESTVKKPSKIVYNKKEKKIISVTQVIKPSTIKNNHKIKQKKFEANPQIPKTVVKQKNKSK